MIKEKTLTIELSHENPLGDGYFYAMLDLPAEEHEIRDAIQRARMLGRENSFRSIGILDCGAWPELLYYRLDSPTIDELNFFANRIAQMDDSELAIFRTVAPKVLGSPADDLLSMKDLISCTYGYDEIICPNSSKALPTSAFANARKWISSMPFSRISARMHTTSDISRRRKMKPNL